MIAALKVALLTFMSLLFGATPALHTTKFEVGPGRVFRDFATTGKVVLFAANADDESIDKWINNQHSCGLFPDVAEPVFTGKLPDGSCTVTERKKIGEAAGPTDNAPFHDYLVKLAVKAHTEPGQYTLEAFETEAEVYLKITAL